LPIVTGLRIVGKNEETEMDWNKRNSSSIYYIRIKGTFNPASFGWMNDASIISQEKDETLIATSITDQAALRGLLEQFWNFNFTVLSVESVDKEG
jgi:hypothetical protein